MSTSSGCARSNKSGDATSIAVYMGAKKKEKERPVDRE